MTNPPPPLTRRALILGAAALPVRSTPNPIAALEHDHGGRLGVFALDTTTNRTLSHRADERVLMCSTFKAPLAACVLHRIDAGLEHPARRIPITAADLLPYAPFSRAQAAHGSATVEQLCQAAIQRSDNTAANLLLASIGGPAALTAFIRTTGDAVTRFDRTEPTLNTPDGARDTTTPRATAHTLQALLTGRALSKSSAQRLNGWLEGCTTGLQRLRAGLPSAWRAGDKTGTGDTQCNDIAILTPPGRAPIFVAAYYTPPPGLPDDAAEQTLRNVGTAIARWAA
jgi:beta-lactamase class A